MNAITYKSMLVDEIKSMLKLPVKDNDIVQINWKDGTKTYRNSKGEIVTTKQTPYDKKLGDAQNQMAIRMVNDSNELVTFTLKHEQPLPARTMAKIILNNNGYHTYKL